MIHIPALSNFAIMGQSFLSGFFVGSSQISVDGHVLFIKDIEIGEIFF